MFVSLVTLEELCENFEHKEKYDGVIASEVLEHVNDADGFIGNIHKLLKVDRRARKIDRIRRSFPSAQRSLFHHYTESNGVVLRVGYCAR